MELIATPTPALSSDPLRLLGSPPAGVGVVELRGDLFPDLDPAAAVAASPLPLLFTLRSRAEGGEGPNDPRRRETVLRRAWEAGCAFLDLEAVRDMELLERRALDPDRVILSWHDPHGTPGDLEDRAADLLDRRARWVKIVPSARTLHDLVRILALHRRYNDIRPVRRRLIAFGMGPAGQASRYLAPLLGPPLAYVAWEAGAPAAPGQVTAADLGAAIGHLHGPPVRLFGVVGRNVTSSRSPRLHGAAYRALDLPWALLPLSVPETAELDLLFRPQSETVFDGLGLSVGGWAVTTPYKEAAARAATVPAPRVRRARSANTLLLRPGQILADTTDADGVVGALRASGIEPAGRAAVVQGTGGAARAAAVGLDLAGATVLLRGRDAGRTGEIAHLLGVEALAPDSSPDRVEILLNATPLGSRPGDPSPFSLKEISRATAVVDMVYGDAPPALEELTSQGGAVYVNGITILLYQGIAQIAAFTGRVPPREALRHALDLPNSS